MSSALVLYTLKAALRDKLVRVVLVLFVLIAALSLFMGGTAVLEQKSFSLVFAASSIRLAAVLGAILFVSFYIQRSYASKDIDFLLSRPISRGAFVASQGLAFLIISVLMGVAAFLTIFALSGGQLTMGLCYWAIGLMVEIALIANVAMFFSMVLSSSVASVAASFGFYILSRMTGAIFGIVDSGQMGGIFKFFEGIVQAVTLILPRLDLIVQTSWLVYGTDGVGGASAVSIPYLIVVGVVFCLFVILATVIDLKRKEF